MIVTRLPLSSALVLPLVFAACGGEGLTLPPEGEAAHITVVDGSPQSGRVGSLLGAPLIVQVTDTRDRPVSGATVVFSFPTAAAGEAIPHSTTTDSDGRASSTLRLGSAPGTVIGRVEVPVPEGITPVEASFTVTALSDDAYGIAPFAGNGQSAPVNSPLPAPLVVQVTDQFGNPIAGLTIGWTAEGGGSVSEASSVTDASGQASVARTLGSTAGQQTTLATAEGLVGSPVIFTHTATAGSATGVVKISGDEQSALVGTELTNPLVVQVLDAQSNPIPNRAVTWVTGDGSVNPENTITDAQGYASTRWTLGLTPGPGKTANAVVSGLEAATFTATATAGLPSASTSSVSASPSTIAAGSGSSSITVTVRDDANNPVGGVSVSVASSGSENTITPPTASTGSNGVATFTFSSTVAETKTITATAGGVAITDGATITVQKVSSVVEITSDEPDASSVGQNVRVEFTVEGNGGTPTGEVTVTVSGGSETCTGPLSGGSGFCDVILLVPGTGSGNRRVITATYAGDARFAGDTDTDNHRVDPLPVANNPPTADFTVPSCTAGQVCAFTDVSTDGDGTIQSRVWNFQDGTPTSSADQSPSVTFGSEGSKTVTLTVTDDDGATDTETKQVVVSAAAPVNQAPVPQDDLYDTPGAGQSLTVLAPGVLQNDTDDGGPLMAQNASDPPLGSVTLAADGGFTYTPDPGATGTDTFTYEAFDGSLATQATVTITIVP